MTCSFIFVSLSLVLLSWAILNKTRTILNHILNSEIIDFDPVAAKYYIKRRHDPHCDNDMLSDSDDCEDLDFAESDGTEIQHTSRIESISMRQSNMFDIEQWGAPVPFPKGLESPNSRNARDLPLPHRDNERSSEDKTQSEAYEYHPNEQEELFWFGSHIFMIRVIQTLLAFLAIYAALLFQYVTWVFKADTVLNAVKVVVACATIPTVLNAIGSTMPGTTYHPISIRR